MVATKFSPSAIEEAKSVKKGEKMTPAVSLDELPLGFNTGDKDVDRAATVLRLLYISDMKQLQTTINDIIVAVQNFTADPKVPSQSSPLSSLLSLLPAQLSLSVALLLSFALFYLSRAHCILTSI